jgi:hypothetical protein
MKMVLVVALSSLVRVFPVVFWVELMDLDTGVGMSAEELTNNLVR